MNLGFIYLNRASSNQLREQKTRAIRNSEKYLSEASVFPKLEGDANRGLGFVMWQKGAKEDAVAYWRESQLPAESLVSFGYRAYELRNWDEALSWYEAAANLDLASSATPLAELLHAQKDYDGAIAVWQNALESYPESQQRLDWWDGLTYSLRSNEEWQEATEVSREALYEFPRSPQLLTGLGSSLLDLNAGYETVTTVLQRSISIDEKYADAYIVMARLMSRENQFEQAYFYFNQAVEFDPSVKWWHVARANMARRLGNIGLARTLLLETIELFPGYSPSYYELARIYKSEGDPIQAQFAIEQALELHNAPPLNYYVRAGEIYAWSNQIELARSAYQRAAEIAPNDERVIKGLESLERGS